MNQQRPAVPLAAIVREWLRLGCVGFGGPPTHIALLRRLCVDERAWIDSTEFNDAIATTNLLPGPASTQLAIYCAWRLQGAIGAVLGGVCFIAPGLAIILVLSAVLLTGDPPQWLLGAAGGASAAVPAVAVNAASSLVPGTWERFGPGRARPWRWSAAAVVGAVATVAAGPYLVVVIVGCGLAEVLMRHRGRPVLPRPAHAVVPVAAVHGAVLGGLVWVAVKVGALSFGGGFVIIPLMQHDAVTTYHWMSGAQFLTAVALGQVTPGPVVQTVAVVGYAADGLAGGMLAALIAFAPSFAFIILGGRHFHRIRDNQSAQAFLTGTGPAVVGAISGTAVTLSLAFDHLWQIPLLAGVLVWLFVLRRGVVSALLVAAIIGVIITATHSVR